MACGGNVFKVNNTGEGKKLTAESVLRLHKNIHVYLIGTATLSPCKEKVLRAVTAAGMCLSFPLP